MSAHVVLSCEQQIDEGVCAVWYCAAVDNVSTARDHAALQGWTYDGTIDRCATCARPRPRSTLATLTPMRYSHSSTTPQRRRAKGLTE